MLRKLLGAGLLLAMLAGCTKLDEGSPPTCTVNADCGEGGACDVATGLCYAEGTEPEDPDGGSCSPACAEYEACTSAGCRPRFTGVNILSPAPNALLTGSADAGVDGGLGEVVTAQLVVNPTYAQTTRLPERLEFRAQGSNDAGVGSFGPVTRSGETYSVPWSLPVIQAQVALTAAYPDADAGVSTTINVTVDTAPPTFTILFSDPPGRTPGTTGSQAEQRDPLPEYAKAFRRDESVTVTVSANETVNESEVVLTLTGIGPGGTPGAVQTVPLTTAGTCNDNPPFCRSALVDLSVPEMRAFRGNMVFRVEGRDGAGNRGSASESLPVTRWKWAFTAGAAAIKGTPAVGQKGTVYIATSETTGKVFALSPNGTSLWTTIPTVGAVSNSLALGEPRSATEEYVYVAAKNPGSVLYALKGSDGNQVQKCPGSGDYGNGPVDSALAVGKTVIVQPFALETAVGVYTGNPSRIVGIRPDAALEADRCITVTGPGGTPIPGTAAGASMLMVNEDIFYGTLTSKLTSYSIGANTPRNNWPQNANFIPRGLALLSDTIYGGQGSTDNADQGSLFSAPVAPGAAGNNVTTVFPPSPNSRVFNLAVGSSNIAFFGSENGPGEELVRLGLSSGAVPTRVTGVGPLRAAPVVGKNDKLYTINIEGKASAWVASTMAPLWELPLGVGGVDVSPTLDCKRDTAGNQVQNVTVGNLYVAADIRLYAFVVDSPGLEAAPWPKYQRDVRNTGNPATPVTNCQ